MSYKLRADQIRTIDPQKYQFSVNGHEFHTVEEMLKVSANVGVALVCKTWADFHEQFFFRSALIMLLLVILNSTKQVNPTLAIPTSCSNVLCAPSLGKSWKSTAVPLLLPSNGGKDRKKKVQNFFELSDELFFFFISHWGTMVGDLSVNLGDGKKLEAPATNEVVESYGITVAHLNDKFQVEKVRESLLWRALHD
jgi:hypothetical protein